MTVMQSGGRFSDKNRSIPALLVWPFVLVTLLFLVRPAVAQTVTFTELYPFNSSGDLSDGGWPEAGVARDADGNLYGTTFFGGTGTGCDIYFGGCGTVFKVDPSGAETVLHSFGGVPDGSNPTARVSLDASGNLYGTTAFGGAQAMERYSKWTVRPALKPSYTVLSVVPMVRTRTRAWWQTRPEISTAPPAMEAKDAIAAAAEPYSN